MCEKCIICHIDLYSDIFKYCYSFKIINNYFLSSYLVKWYGYIILQLDINAIAKQLICICLYLNCINTILCQLLYFLKIELL